MTLITRSSATAMRSRTLQRPQAIRRQRSGSPSPLRIVLHLLVGAVALISAQAIANAFLATKIVVLGEAQVAHAEQSAPSTSSVSAPALSTHPAQTEGVMGDLGAAIGRRVAPDARTWRGVAGQDVNLRSQPNRSAPPVGLLKAGTAVEVVDWVAGEDVEPRNDTWAKLSDGTYAYSTSLRRVPTTATPALPENAPTTGRWIDVNLTEQIATAYDGHDAVRSVLISTGQPGWDTPTGVFPVLRRLAKDDMDGSTLVGQGPRGIGADYKVDNVRWVQYFTDDGAAIHENYWRRPATFGMPGSHGCIGLLPADATWFWDFATVGTPLVIHN
jgi:lipoprotein-anchoring transpeptidase ErfK/SrfK